MTGDKQMRQEIRGSIPSADLWLRRLDRDVRQGNRSFMVVVQQRTGQQEDRLVAAAYFHQEKYPVTSDGKVSFEKKGAWSKDVLVLEMLEVFPDDVNRVSVVREVLYRGFGWAQENGVEKITVLDPDGLKNMRVGHEPLREYLKSMGFAQTSTTYLGRVEETALKVFESMFCSFEDIDRGIPLKRSALSTSDEGEDDPEMVSPPQPVVDGGIDLKARSMAVEVMGDNAEFTLPGNGPGIDPDNLQGLRPVIISITSIGDMPALLGLN